MQKIETCMQGVLVDTRSRMVDTILGWNGHARRRAVKALSPVVLLALLVLVFKLVKMWDATKGMVLSVARTKIICRAFAWGCMGWLSLVCGMNDALMFAVSATGPDQLSDDQLNLLVLHDIYDEHHVEAGLASVKSICKHKAVKFSTHSLQLLRAVYMLGLVVFQTDTPFAKEFGIDVDQVAAAIGMSREELFALAEREAQRPGCQFGVLLRVLRENKMFSVEWEGREEQAGKGQ